MKRILSTIEEASSNTSSGVTNKFSANYNFASSGDCRIFNRLADIARELGSEVREANLIDLDENDSCNVPNGFVCLPKPHEILQPIRVSCSSPRHAHFKNDTSATYSQPKRKPNSTNRRPNSGDITSNFSPRFLHLNMCGDVEEEFLKISRAHCRKLLQLDRDKLNHILESEPLKLPKITTVSTVRGCTHKLKRKTVVKLPPVQASWGIKSPSQVRIRHSPGKGRRQTRIPIRESGAEFYNSEPDLVESKLMVEGVRFNLSPRPNSNFTKSTTITTSTTEINTKHNINDYNPFVSAERQLMELLECDDLLDTPPAPPPTIQNTPRPRTSDPAIKCSNKPAALKSHQRPRD
ncbi:hypothetical protein QE152_g25408 [Popillia japonica]|uniref:Uncharacterized protein n=1 Tax=Popillia japonica TaxID=7064 RepID=A0AAW1K2Y2_POPJA